MGSYQCAIQVAFDNIRISDMQSKITYIIYFEFWSSCHTWLMAMLLRKCHFCRLNCWIFSLVFSTDVLLVFKLPSRNLRISGKSFSKNTLIKHEEFEWYIVRACIPCLPDVIYILFLQDCLFWHVLEFSGFRLAHFQNWRMYFKIFTKVRPYPYWE